MLAIKGQSGSTECYYLRYFDYEELKLLEAYLDREDVLLDVGANIGSYAMLAAACGADAYAYEPVPNTFKIMNQIAEFNPAIRNRIHMINAAVGKKPDTVEMTDSVESTTNHIITDDPSDEVPRTMDSTIRVSQICLDQQNYIRPVTVLKIDVEGFEDNVLRGASNILNSPELKIVIIEDFKSGKFDSILGAYGFARCGYHVDANRIIAGENLHGDNALYVKDICAVNNRLAG